MHLHAPAPDVRDRAPVGDALAAVVARCLAKNPADRFPTAADLASALRATVSAPRSARDGTGTGVYVEVRPAGAATDEVLEVVDDVVDAMRAAVERAGFTVAFAAGSALLAVAATPGSSAEVQSRSNTWKLVMRSKRSRGKSASEISPLWTGMP